MKMLFHFNFQILGNADNDLAQLFSVQQLFHCSEQCNSTEVESPLLNETLICRVVFLSHHHTLVLFQFLWSSSSAWCQYRSVPTLLFRYPYTFLVLLFQHSCRISHERHSEQGGQHTSSHGNAHQCTAGPKMVYVLYVLLLHFSRFSFELQHFAYFQIKNTAPKMSVFFVILYYNTIQDVDHQRLMLSTKLQNSHNSYLER